MTVTDARDAAQGTYKPAIGSKPCFVLDGALWRTDERIAVVGNLIVDFFRGQVLSKVNLAGLDHVIVLTVTAPDTIYFRHYAITLKKSGTKVVDNNARVSRCVFLMCLSDSAS